MLLQYCSISLNKVSFKNTISLSNGLKPDQNQRYVGPGLGPSCLQSLLVDYETRRYQGHRYNCCLIS